MTAPGGDCQGCDERAEQAWRKRHYPRCSVAGCTEVADALDNIERPVCAEHYGAPHREDDDSWQLED